MNSWFRDTITSLYNAVTAPVAATRDALSKRLQSVRDTATLLYNKTKEKLGYRQSETLKDIEENEAVKEHKEEQEEQQDLIPQEHEEALNGAYRSFRSPGLPKVDLDTYIDRELQSVVQLHMWVQWRKEEEGPAFRLDGEEREGVDLSGSTIENAIKVDKVFNSKMTEVFQGSDIDEILSAIFAHIKTQVENPKLPKSRFTLDHIMHLDIDFHKLVLTRGSSYIELPEWIAKKKAIINSKSNDEECFKWAVIAALHHEDIKWNPERVSNLSLYINQYNWQGLEFALAVNKIGKFEKNNPDIAVNVLFTSKNKDGEVDEI